MKIPEDIKSDIQCFVYFLFKGTLDPRLIAVDFDYLDKLLESKELLYNCFEIYAYAVQEVKDVIPDQLVAEYILALHEEIDEKTLEVINKAKDFNRKSNTYWTDFLLLAKWFCYNSFPKPLNEDYIKGLHGCGSDAVPAFAVWTNVVEIDDKLKVKNSTHALTRANERIKSWDTLPINKFEDWEREQEIY